LIRVAAAMFAGSLRSARDRHRRFAAEWNRPLHRSTGRGAGVQRRRNRSREWRQAARNDSDGANLDRRRPMV